MSGFTPLSFRGGGGGRGGRGGGRLWHPNNNSNSDQRGNYNGSGGRRGFAGRGRGGGGRGGGGGGFFRGGRGGGGGRGLIVDLPLTEYGSPSSEPSKKTISFAVEGCCHGELDSIYDRLLRYERETGRKVDVLLCCGDFQSLRNAADYHSLAVPPKYRTLGSFCRYYSGERLAPMLTLFVSGNHEASQPLQELYYGGWVAPRIYYLGAAGVVNVGGVRIGGISGIYKSHDYPLGRFERPPYDNSSLRSVYHIRSLDVYRMKCLNSQRQRLDVMLSHDWPEGVERYGNTEDLLRRKPFFRNEVEQRCLGSPPNRELLETLQPKWWFAAHLHVSFSALIDHPKVNTATKALTPADLQSLVPSQAIRQKKKTAKPAEDLDSQTPASTEAEEDFIPLGSPKNDDNNAKRTQFQSLESSSNPCQEGPDLTTMMTQFLSLDKCLPRRHCMSIVHVPVESQINADDVQLEYDVEWLTVLRKTHHLTVADRIYVPLPDEPMTVLPEDLEETQQLLLLSTGNSVDMKNCLKVPDNFSKTVPVHSNPIFARGQPQHHLPPPMPFMGNPQTDKFLKVLGLKHVFTIPHSEDNSFSTSTPMPQAPMPALSADPMSDDNEIEIDDDNSNAGAADNGDEEEAGDSLPKMSGGVDGTTCKNINVDDNEIEIENYEEGDDDDSEAGDVVFVEAGRGALQQRPVIDESAAGTSSSRRSDDMEVSKKARLGEE